MTDLYTVLTSVTGAPPAGYEPIIWIFGGLIAYRVVDTVAGLFEMMGGSLQLRK